MPPCKCQGEDHCGQDTEQRRSATPRGSCPLVFEVGIRSFAHGSVRSVKVGWSLVGVWFRFSTPTATFGARQGSVVDGSDARASAQRPGDLGPVPTARGSRTAAAWRPAVEPRQSWAASARRRARSSWLRAWSARPRDLAGHARLGEARDDAARLPPEAHPALDDGAREGLVVEEPDLLETLQFVGDGIGLEAGLGEPALELPAAALPHGKEPERPLVDVLPLPAGPAVGGHRPTRLSCRPWRAVGSQPGRPDRGRSGSACRPPR